MDATSSSQPSSSHRDSDHRHDRGRASSLSKKRENGSSKEAGDLAERASKKPRTETRATQEEVVSREEDGSMLSSDGSFDIQVRSSSSASIISTYTIPFCVSRRWDMCLQPNHATGVARRTR